mgnify:CR=1 FL=1
MPHTPLSTRPRPPRGRREAACRYHRSTLIPEQPPARPAEAGTAELDAVRAQLAAGVPLTGSMTTALSRLATDEDPGATEDSIATLPAVRLARIHISEPTRPY